MFFCIYSKKFGWNPLRYFLLKKKNFYRARKKWLVEHKKEVIENDVMQITGNL